MAGPRPEPLPGLVTDLTGATHRPLRISERFRAGMVDRVALHGPVGQSDLVDVRKRLNGLPMDVLVHLEALAFLADKGNRLAAEILLMEREKLGIDPGRRYFPT